MMSALFVGAQTNIGLVAYYTFENSAEDATGNTANGGLVTGAPTYGCGVNNNSIQLDYILNFWHIYY